MNLVFAALLLASAPGSASASSDQDANRPEWADCTIVHYGSDGVRTVREPRAASSASDGAAASVAARGSHSSSRTVSASSRNGGATSSASASSAGGGRRSVTQTREAGRCVVTIDER